MWLLSAITLLTAATFATARSIIKHRDPPKPALTSDPYLYVELWQFTSTDCTFNNGTTHGTKWVLDDPQSEGWFDLSDLQYNTLYIAETVGCKTWIVHTDDGDEYPGSLDYEVEVQHCVQLGDFEREGLSLYRKCEGVEARDEEGLGGLAERSEAIGHSPTRDVSTTTADPAIPSYSAVPTPGVVFYQFNDGDEHIACQEGTGIRTALGGPQIEACYTLSNDVNAALYIDEVLGCDLGILSTGGPCANDYKFPTVEGDCWHLDWIREYYGTDVMLYRHCDVDRMPGNGSVVENVALSSSIEARASDAGTLSTGIPTSNDRSTIPEPAVDFSISSENAVADVKRDSQGDDVPTKILTPDATNASPAPRSTQTEARRFSSQNVSIDADASGRIVPGHRFFTFFEFTDEPDCDGWGNRWEVDAGAFGTPALTGCWPVRDESNTFYLKGIDGCVSTLVSGICDIPIGFDHWETPGICKNIDLPQRTGTMLWYRCDGGL